MVSEKANMENVLFGCIRALTRDLKSMYHHDYKTSEHPNIFNFVCIKAQKRETFFIGNIS